MPPQTPETPNIDQPTSPAPPFTSKRWVLTDDGKSHELQMREHGLMARVTRKNTGAYAAQMWMGNPYAHPDTFRPFLYIQHADSQDQAIEKLADQFSTWASEREEEVLYAFMP